MHRAIGFLLLKWIANSFGIWLAVRTIGTGHVDTPDGIAIFIIVGLVFSLINSVIKPIFVVLSLPILIVSLGLFMFVINGLVVYLTFSLIPDVEITFGYSILVGIIVSLVNYVLGGLLEVQYPKK